MIDLDGVRPLRDPVLLAAFEGWNDAGEAASDAVEHLEDVWDAELVGELDPEEYYDFQVNRPYVGTEEDGTRALSWPGTRLSVAWLPDQRRDVVLVRGIEPSMRWRAYCAELVTAARGLGVSTVVTVGALLADTPHSRPVPVTSSTSHPQTPAKSKGKGKA